jgi:hypothetical protein
MNRLFIARYGNNPYLAARALNGKPYTHRVSFNVPDPSEGTDPEPFTVVTDFKGLVEVTKNIPNGSSVFFEDLNALVFMVLPDASAMTAHMPAAAQLRTFFTGLRARGITYSGSIYAIDGVDTVDNKPVPYTRWSAVSPYIMSTLLSIFNLGFHYVYTDPQTMKLRVQANSALALRYIDTPDKDWIVEDGGVSLP